MRNLKPEKFLAYAHMFSQAWDAILNAPIEHVTFGTGHISGYESGKNPLLYVVFEGEDGPAVERRFEVRTIHKYFRKFNVPEDLCWKVERFWAQIQQKQKNEQIARQSEQKAVQGRKVVARPASANASKSKAEPQSRQEKPAAAVKDGSGTQGCPYCPASVFPQGLEQHIKAAHKKTYKTWKKENQRKQPEKTKRNAARPRPPVVECPLCYTWLRKTSLKGHYKRFHRKHEVPDDPRVLTPLEVLKYNQRRKPEKKWGPGVLVPISMRMIRPRR